MKRAYAMKAALAALAMGLSLGLVTGCGSDDSAKADCSKCSGDLKATCDDAVAKCTGSASECQQAADLLCAFSGDGGLTITGVDGG